MCVHNRKPPGDSSRVTNVLWPTCRFSPAWLWWRRRTGRCQRRGWGRAPPAGRSRSPLWSSYGLALPSGEVPRPRPGPRCSSQEPCRGHRPARRWGAASGPGPADCGCWRRAWWERWSRRCWGFLSWRPEPHLEEGEWLESEAVSMGQVCVAQPRKREKEE